MKKITLLIILSQFFSQSLFPQSNCGSPLNIGICPSVNLTNQTNAGMGDDAQSGCNITGEDVVYEIPAPNGADKIYVTVENASGPLQVSIELDSCGTGSCSALQLPAGNSEVSFNVTSTSVYYLWVDAATTVTYDISFGADTGTVWVNVPNTQGNLQFENSACALPTFQVSKPYFQVSYNGVFKTYPLVLSPLFIPGTMCITTYFENMTGVEGIKKFDFTFDTAGFTNISTPGIIPGTYNAGDWIAGNVGNLFSFVFVDSANTGKGDFTGSPNTCLKYEFCFDMTPVSNDSLLTNVGIEIFSDGFGTGFTGPVTLGCCPVTSPGCMTGGGGGGIENSPHSFTFSFNDPAAFPVELIDFTASVVNEKVILKWITASEINNDYFTIEKSKNGKDWIRVEEVKGNGNSTTNRYYSCFDHDPFSGVSFYRLKQTDFDGTFKYSPAVAVNFKGSPAVRIYPNPSHNQFLLDVISPDQEDCFLLVRDLTGREIESYNHVAVNKTFSFGKGLPGGFYFAEVVQGDVRKIIRVIKN